MRNISAVVVLLIMAGAVIVRDLRPAHTPPPRTQGPPSPSAVDEGDEVLRLSPAPPKGLSRPDIAAGQRRQVATEVRPIRRSPAAIAPLAPSQRTVESPSTLSAPTITPPAGMGPRHEQAQPPTSTVKSATIGADAAGASSSAVFSEAPVERVPVTTPPVLQTPASLAYPAEAFRIELNRTALTPALTVQAIDGRVMLKVLVQADGTVRRVEITHSSGSAILDEAASREAAAWRFRPATRDGLPIDAWALIPVRFVVP